MPMRCTHESNKHIFIVFVVFGKYRHKHKRTRTQQSHCVTRGQIHVVGILRMWWRPQNVFCLGALIKRAGCPLAGFNCNATVVPPTSSWSSETSWDLRLVPPVLTVPIWSCARDRDRDRPNTSRWIPGDNVAFCSSVVGSGRLRSGAKCVEK